MMEEHESETSSIHDAEVHVCIFPHLEEFMVLDARDTGAPQFHVLRVDEMLTPEYYAEVEREFSQMLRSSETPFLNLMTLPQRLELFLRKKGMDAISRLAQTGNHDEDQGRVSLFLCAGPILSMSDEDVAEAMEAFFRDGPPRTFIRDYGDAFQRLLEKEKGHIKNRQQEELRRAAQGRSNQFYTLWQEQGGPDLN